MTESPESAYHAGQYHLTACWLCNLVLSSLSSSSPSLLPLPSLPPPRLSSTSSSPSPSYPSLLPLPSPPLSIKKDWPVIPSLDEIKEYKVVVSTLVMARTLRLMGMEKGYFTHIFIDEAAQVLCVCVCVCVHVCICVSCTVKF